jgi:hypothetical protein
MLRRPYFTLGFASIIFVSFASIGLATTLFPPYRAITHDEILFDSCELSDAIVAVRIDRIFGEFYRDKRDRSGAGIPGSIAECTVLRTLKGGIRAGERIRVDLTNDSRVSRENEHSCGVMLLCRSKVDSRRWAAGANGPLPGWKLNSGPNRFQMGFGAGPCGTRGAAEQQVQSALQQSEPEQLAAQSDIVVVANVGEKFSSCSIDGDWRSCAVLTKFDQIYGPRESVSVRVVAAIPGYLQSGKQVLYLKCITPGTFEIVGLSAGAQAISWYRVGRSKRWLNEVVNRVRKAEVGRIRQEKKIR